MAQTIHYKCACLQDEATFQVRDRRDGEDVVAWVQGPLTAALAADHHARSPSCRAGATEYVKIPAPENADYLGGPVRLDS